MSVDADADMEGLFAGEREDERAMFGDEDDEVGWAYARDRMICTGSNLKKKIISLNKYRLLVNL